MFPTDTRHNHTSNTKESLNIVLAFNLQPSSISQKSKRNLRSTFSNLDQIRNDTHCRNIRTGTEAPEP